MMKIASPLKRLMAYILDGISVSIIYGICVTLAGLPLFFINGAMTHFLNDSGWISTLVGGTYALYALILLLAVFIIQCLFWAKGTTLGKSILNMKVGSPACETGIINNWGDRIKIQNNRLVFGKCYLENYS